MSQPRRHASGHRPPRKADVPAGQDRGWDAVAAWYDKLVGESGSDYHQQVILPAAMRLLEVQPGESVIDVCCGQGVLAPLLLEAGAAAYHGVDASPRLIAAAKARYGKNRRVSLTVADACAPGPWADASHDAAVCLMAVHDVPDIDALFRNLRASIRPGGRAVLVFMHPCFRIPKRSHWGFDNDQKIQFRRLDAYGSAEAIPVTTHPGREQSSSTTFYHRPLSMIISALGKAGLAVNACEELFSHRRSQGSGPFSKAEHKAAAEFPLFIALRVT
jgi:ubiquinone/menaquinone biosynthesis C-methylase UbiE